VRVAVTGATGFVGRHLTDGLMNRGHHVRFLARRPGRVVSDLLGRGAEAIPGDLADSAALAALAAGADAVLHLVGIIAEHGAATFSAVHVEGTRRLIEAARGSGASHFVYMSALGVRPDPDATPYHRTKWQAEELVRGSGLRTTIFRPSLINGPENVPVRTLARVHRWAPVIPVFGRADFPLQPVWIGDVALAFALALERSAAGTFELGGPEMLTFAAFVRAIGTAVGHPRPLLHVPLAWVRGVARALDPLGPWAPITSGQLQMLTEGTTTPANAISRVFGIAPLTFGQGLAQVFQKDQTRG
jgi:uncharacterized protein YbjT (DUF2867 family)